MFENYPLLRYTLKDFDQSDLSQAIEENSYEPGNEELMALADARYRITGYIDLLPRIPLPEDDWHRQLHLQSFACMHVAGDYYTERSDVKSYLVLYTLAGEGSLAYRGITYRLAPNDAFFIDCREPHHYGANGVAWEHADLHVYGADAELYYREFQKAGASPVVPSPSFIYADLARILDMYTEPSSYRNMLIGHAIRSLLVDMIQSRKSSAVGYLPVSETAEKIKAYIEHLNTHYAEPVSAESMSNAIGVSKFHLSRLFRKMTGFPPNEYVIRLRIENAKIILQSTDLPIRDVAMLVGIDNEAYFSRLFKRRTGRTARAFRASVSQRSDML